MYLRLVISNKKLHHFTLSCSFLIEQKKMVGISGFEPETS